MSGFDQVSFGSDDVFVANPEPRCPCLLLLDTSHSMQGRAITELNNGIIAFKGELAADALVMKRIQQGLLEQSTTRDALSEISTRVAYWWPMMRRSD